MKKYLLLLMALVLVSCLDFMSNSPDEKEEEVFLNQSKYEIQFGETINTQNIGKVTFTDMLEDSRCPIDVECFWEGNLKISLEIDGKKYELNTALEPKSIVVNDLKISIYDALPERISTIENKKEEYRITLIVE